MPNSIPSDSECAICGQGAASAPGDDASLCPQCYEKSEALFQEELRRLELVRTIRGLDVEVYDVKHPASDGDKHHCGQVILIKSGMGFEVKICLRADALDWMANLRDNDGDFVSADNRLDALIGNVSLLIQSWGGGPHYMDIFFVDQTVSTEGEI